MASAQSAPSIPAPVPFPEWFNPSPPKWRGYVSSDPNADFPAEKGRYVLYIHYGCPWAHRCNIAYRAKGLFSIVGFSALSIHRNGDNGWSYDGTDESDDRDTFNGFRNMRELYETADPDYTGSYSVPVLWDRSKNTIVSNDYNTIMRSFLIGFDDLVQDFFQEKHWPGGGLVPTELTADIDALNALISAEVGWGVYKCGLAKTQEQYDESMQTLYKRLDWLEERLGKTRFLMGEHVTEADIGLFAILVRFDMAYATIMRCIHKTIRQDYPHLHRYVRELYWKPPHFALHAFFTTTYFKIMMEGYARGAMRQVIVPWGPKIPIMRLDD